MWLSYLSSHSWNDGSYGPRTAREKPKFDPPRNDLPRYSEPIGIPGQWDQLSWCNQCVRIKFGQLGNLPSMLAKYKEVEECLNSITFVILIYIYIKVYMDRKHDEYIESHICIWYYVIPSVKSNWHSTCQKAGLQKEGSSSNHPFSGAILVSGEYIYILYT